ncbi:MAG: hypothetical protein E7223_04425 [Clostridiales bacterium]|nr:hypothetical protein [Clostridiales bacterium]
MKKKTFAASIGFILMVALAGALFMGNTLGAPGSEADPVVTKSYVENYVTTALNNALNGPIKSAIDSAVSKAKTDIKAELSGTGTEGGSNTDTEGNTGTEGGNNTEETTGTAASAPTFIVVNVPAGTKIIGKGGTEMILRGGSAKAIDNGVDGVSDLTGAKDLLGGTKISPNHLLLIPRDDGRGIEATSEVWVMVKGDYILK